MAHLGSRGFPAWPGRSLGSSPRPGSNRAQVLAVSIAVRLVLDELVLDRLLAIGVVGAEARQTICDVWHPRRSIQIVPNAEQNHLRILGQVLLVRRSQLFLSYLGSGGDRTSAR